MGDDREFDRMIEEELTQLPLSDQEIEEITPWKRAMRRIVWGIGLLTVTLNFWCLNYLLPAVGVVLLWLGFRALRRENKWFAACWIISLYRAADLFVRLVASATLWRQGGDVPAWMWLTLAIPLAQYLCLWQGIRAVRRKAGQPDQAGAAGALAAFYVLLCALGLVGVEGWLFGLPVLAAYICILRNLAKLPTLLDGAGYEVHAAPGWLSDRTVWIGWTAALVVCIPLAALLFGRYPMEWAPVEAEEQAGLEEIRDNLLELGFPRAVLDDLSAEDLADCAGALRVNWEVDEEPMNDGYEVSQTEGGITHVWTEYDVYELKLTSVAVELPDNRWKVIHHFLWLAAPKVRGTESLQLWIYGITPENYFVSEDQYSLWLSGRLLWDRDNVTYTGDYYSLGQEDYLSYSFFGTEARRDVFAEFSLPLGGENCRGYVAYTAQRSDWDKILFDSWMNYTHQRSWFNYPAGTAKEYRQGNIFSSRVFKTVQTQLLTQLSAES